jgi:CRISPR-associated protein Cas1
MGLALHPDKTQITTFDKGFRFLGHVFAGDVILTASKENSLPRSGHPQDQELRLVHADPDLPSSQMQQAMVEALKTAQHPIPPPLFVVLGYKVRESQPVTICSNETPWNPAMSTLYLMQQGTTLKTRTGTTHHPTAKRSSNRSTPAGSAAYFGVWQYSTDYSRHLNVPGAADSQ